MVAGQAGTAIGASFRAVKRPHAADEVFDQLAGSIVRGELAPGSALPPERVLGEQFGISRMIVRQAVHRLADMGLVRVKQGGTTLVLDPDEACDIRLIDLYYRLGPSPALAANVVRDVIEKQFLQGLSLIDVANRRASAPERKQIQKLTAAFDPEKEDDHTFIAFEERFWRAVAASGKNRIFVMEVGFWYKMLAERPRAREVSSAPLATRIAFYRELARRLVAREDPTRYYLDVVGPILDALSAAREPRGAASERR